MSIKYSDDDHKKTKPRSFWRTADFSSLIVCVISFCRLADLFKFKPQSMNKDQEIIVYLNKESNRVLQRHPQIKRNEDAYWHDKQRKKWRNELPEEELKRAKHCLLLDRPIVVVEDSISGSDTSTLPPSPAAHHPWPYRPSHSPSNNGPTKKYNRPLIAEHLQNPVKRHVSTYQHKSVNVYITDQFTDKSGLLMLNHPMYMLANLN